LTVQTFKLFVSSPGDVMIERRRVENVVSRLNGEFAGVARLQAIRWETEFYQAFSTFQAQIPRSTDCDLVIGILKWRLGSELPPDFADKLPNGRPFPSGTAYEILSAVKQRQKGGRLPDIYVFRFAASSPSVAIDDPDRDRIEREWQVLKGFLQEWFLTAQGHFKAAFNPYRSEDDFETQLEKLLRKWVADKVAGGRAVRWPIAVKGSPFRGLAAFGAKHAPVFFGRSEDTARALDLWREGGHRGSPYLLIVGASGSGKSSLVRAGLIPRLTTAGVIGEVDAWRIAVIRPGDSTGGLFAALAAALMQDDAGLPKEEEGRGPALPEIALGDSKTPAELAAVLRHADAAAVKPVVNALGRVGAAERERERYDREVRCDLVLLIDQLEELFAQSVSDGERADFIDLIASLVATGRVWVAATLRADFYGRMLVQPGLKKLKETGATYDLAPPGPVELAEIVRGPAEAAGLIFGTDAASGEPLDARLLRDADRPDMLPLVQLALSRVFQARESIGGETVLPLNAYEGLGGLKGIIDDAGETALASLGETEKAQLPRLLRQLAVPAHDQDGAGTSLTIRSMPLAKAAPDPTARKLLDALVTARLLTTSGAEADAQVRLAHQRVLEDWARARAIVTESADFYRIRADLEESRRKWETGKRRRELLLARGLPLAEAESIVGKYGDELSPDVVAFVRASRARANLGQLIGWSAAAVFFLLAIGAGIAATVAIDQRTAAEAARAQAQHEAERADRNFSAAKRTVEALIFDIAQGLRETVGMRVETIRRILTTVQKTSDQLTQTAPDDPELLRSRSVMFNNFATTYLAAGDLQNATAAVAQALEVARNLAARDTANPDAQRDVWVALNKTGEVRLRAGDGAGALVAYNESLAIARQLAARDSRDARAQRDVSVSLSRLADIKLQSGDGAAAIAAYQEALDITRGLAVRDPGNADAQRDLSVTLNKIGDVKLRAGDGAGALTAYQASLAIRRKLAALDPGNAEAQRDLSVSLTNLGDVKLRVGDGAGALAAYQENLEIARRLAAVDRGNAQAQRDLSVSLSRLGNVKLRAGDTTGALAAYQEDLDIARRLAAQDPADVEAQRDVSVGVIKIGDVKLSANDTAGAIAAYREGLEIRRKLAAQHPHDAQTQRDMAVALTRLGDADRSAGDAAGALAAYREGLGIARQLATEDPANVQAQTAVVVTLYNISMVSDTPEARDALTEALSVMENLDRERKLTQAQKSWLDVFRAALAKLR
jgi:tetratricopeptide (TPR) repeat protein